MDLKEELCVEPEIVELKSNFDAENTAASEDFGTSNNAFAIFFFFAG